MNTLKNCSVKVVTKEKTFQFVIQEESSLLSGLQLAGQEVLALCGGNGRC